MILKLGIIMVGFLLIIWGIYQIKTESKNKKMGFNILDILLNGWGSGIGTALSGIVFFVIGIVLLLSK